MFQTAFIDPQKENTRRFFRQMRALEFHIDSNNFDFIGANAETIEHSYDEVAGSTIKMKLR